LVFTEIAKAGSDHLHPYKESAKYYWGPEQKKDYMYICPPGAETLLFKMKYQTALIKTINNLELICYESTN